jgi:hypothetical protein
VFFGAVETSIIAYTKIAGKPIYGGIVIALWSFGSLIGGEGLFKLVGDEETKIRKDPASRVSDLLKKVFG